MKSVIVCVLTAFLAGCAMTEQIRRNREEHDAAYARSLAEKARIAEEIAVILEYKRNLRPGLTMKEVTAVFGEPERSEFTKDKIIHWYDSDEEPIFLIYSSAGILESKFVDSETLNAREHGRQQRALQHRLEAIQNTQAVNAFANAMQGISTQSQLNQIQNSQNQIQYNQNQMKNQMQQQQNFKSINGR